MIATIALRDKFTEMYTRTPSLAKDWVGRHAGPKIVWLESGTEFCGETGRREVVRMRGQVVFWTA